MIFLRLVFGLLLVAALLCFALFAFTGHQGWRQRGVQIVKWTLIAAAGVGVVILLEHFMPGLNL